MKFVSYLTSKKEERAGFWLNDQLFDLEKSAKKLSIRLPSTVESLLLGENKTMKLALKVFQTILKEPKRFSPASQTQKISPKILKFLAPLPHPPSMRDAYAFRQHVESARRNRGLQMIPEFDQFPVFYYTNHNAVVGEGDVVVESDHLQKLDFELEIAAIIGRHGKNIDSKEADAYIAGFTIMNDFSARELQAEEMKLNLGPSKGKDFATAMGPWLVTVDELKPFEIKTAVGNRYDLPMKAYHNGKLISEGNMKEMNWTFAEIIERVSYGVEIFPGDVIGSGTVGTGCYMELNGTWAREAEQKGGKFTPVWLKGGDTIELEITGLGRLKNTILPPKKHYSILEKKKNV